MNFSEPHGNPFSIFRLINSISSGSSPSANHSDQLLISSNNPDHFEFVVNVLSFLNLQ